MTRSNAVRLGLCLPVLALLGLAGCVDNHRDSDGRYGGGYYGRNYAYPYGGYNRGWWGRDRSDDRREARDDWKERKYDRREDNGRPGDAERLNKRLCNNGIRGDAPADCN
jgi:hypothetical protein